MNIKLRHSIWGRLTAVFFGGVMETFIDADIVSASVEYADPTKVLINFGWNLDGTTPDASAFTLAGKTITNVSVVGAQIVLTVSVAYVYGDSIVVDYTVPPANRLTQDGTGYIVNSWVGQVVANHTNEADVITYVSGLTTAISDTQLAYINTFVAGYKSDDGLTNLSDAYDVMYYLGNETAESSLRNLVKRAHDAVAVNSPTFTPYEGWAGDGISSYIDTNYNPATEADNYSLNNASLGVYSRTDAHGLYTDIGLRTGTDDYTTILTRYSANTIIRIHNGVNPSITDAESNSLGMFIATRDAAGETGLFGYHNKSALTRTETGNTTNIPNCNIFIGARNYNTTPEQLSPRQLSFAFAGAHRTQTSVNYLTDRFEALMDSNGKGVL
jgi:hypothetical protein